MRLKDANPKNFRQFWAQVQRVKTPVQARKLFKKCFPDYTRNLVGRLGDSFLGEDDDAQVIDAVLFRQLKKGFSEYVDYSWEPSKPHVLFTDLGEGEWDEVEIIGNYWVVVIDYHH